uniref:Uncharacterized protein n=1 Tax=Agrobacterium tumefaciens TaxID=358 RepID=K7WT73_AGRTU|nr:Hypothetical protein [Agrobacterium radiobacter]
MRRWPIAARPCRRSCRSRPVAATASPSFTLFRPFRCPPGHCAPALGPRDGPRSARPRKRRLKT